MKKLIYLIIILHNIISAQDFTLTLEKSIELGLENSKELLIAKSQVDKADAIIREVSASMLPKLSISASYAKLSDVPPFQVNLPVLPGPFTIQETFLDNYNLRATIEQPLFTGFKLSSLKSAGDYNKSAERIKLTKEVIEKVDNIHESFWRLYISQQISSLVNGKLEALNAHLQNTNSMLNNGLVTKNDLLKLKVEVSNTELNLVDAENNEKLAVAAFNKIIGLPFGSNTEIIADQVNIDSEFSNLEDLLVEAGTNRQELLSTKELLNALSEKESVARADWYPQLYAFGNFYYNNPNQRFLPLQDEFNDSWDLGISLKWNVWNWGGTSAKVDQAKYDYLNLDNSLKLLEENIQLDVYKNYLNLQKAEKKIELSLLQVESAEENYRITNTKYYERLANSTDLIDAETSLLNARTNLITSKVEYELSRSSLNKALGRVRE